MSQLTFKRITPELSRIYDDDGCVGEVYSRPDIPRAGRFRFRNWRSRRSVSN